MDRGLGCLATPGDFAAADILTLSSFRRSLACSGFCVKVGSKARGVFPETYGYEQAGEIIGRGFVLAMLSLLVLVFVRWRKLTGLRILAGLSVLFSLVVSPPSLLLTVPTLVLTLLHSTKAYCRVDAPAQPPAA